MSIADDSRTSKRTKRYAYNSSIFNEKIIADRIEYVVIFGLYDIVRHRGKPFSLKEGYP